MDRPVLYISRHNNEEESYNSSMSDDSVVSSVSEKKEHYLCSFCKTRLTHVRNNVNMHLCVSTHTDPSSQPSADNSSAATSASTSAKNMDQQASAGPSNMDQEASGSGLQHEEIHLCNTCNTGFTDPVIMSDHQQEHITLGTFDPNDATPFKCILCPAKFADRKLVLLHLLAAHKKSREENFRKPAELWFKPIGCRQMRLGGGDPGSNLNGIYGVVEGIVMGITTDFLPIGPVLASVSHNVNTTCFTEREFWDTVRNDIIPAFNRRRRRGLRMFVSYIPRRDHNNNRN